MNVIEAILARRSIREFEARPGARAVPRAAGSRHGRPSGMNNQPWAFVVIDDPAAGRAARPAEQALHRPRRDRGLRPSGGRCRAALLGAGLRRRDREHPAGGG